MTTTSTKIVAEIGANHHQDFSIAQGLIFAAKDVGADAVKVQMFEPEKMAPDSMADHFLAESPWVGLSLYNLYRQAAMPLGWIPKLKAFAEEIGIEFFASVYYPEMVDVAEEIGIPIYKIASFEINYTDLLKRVAETKKPVIVSTGAAEYDDIKKAVVICNPTLLKCVSAYPSTIGSMNLNTIPAMAKEFGVPVGLSDHSTGVVAPVVARTLGAMMIEKHLTLDEKGLDGDFSILPDRFRTMVQTIRAAEESFGKVKYEGIKKYRRAMVAVTDIAKGQKMEGKVYPYRTVPEGKMEIHKYAGRNYLKGEMI